MNRPETIAIAIGELFQHHWSQAQRELPIMFIPSPRWNYLALTLLVSTLQLHWLQLSQRLARYVHPKQAGIKIWLTRSQNSDSFLYILACASPSCFLVWLNALMKSKNQLAKNHPRLLLALGAGAALGMSLPHSWGFVTRILTGWNAAIWAYLVLIGWVMIRANASKTVSKLAAREDNSAIVVLVMLSVAAGLSLVAIVYELSSAKSVTPEARLFDAIFTAVTVLSSWLLLATIFTLHYARLFYQSPEQKRALKFPDDETVPDYWDFAYFSFTIAVAVQTSDIAIMSRTMRKAVLAQSLMSFAFNAAIIGLSINIAASLVGS